MTPGRQTYMDVDIPQYVLEMPPYEMKRVGGEVAKACAIGRGNATDMVGMYFRAPLQAWTLQPIQANISAFTEFDTLAPFIHGLSSWNCKTYCASSRTSGMVEKPIWRSPDELDPAFASSTSMVASGDPFICKNVSNNQWNIGINSDHQVSIPNSVIDRVAESQSSFPENTGFFLRWSIPGTDRTNPYGIRMFYFGQYVITFDGSGLATLYEITDQPGSTSGGWMPRAASP